MKPIRIVGGELQREPEWSDDEYAMHLHRHLETRKIGAASLLAQATYALVHAMMQLPDDAVDFDEHGRHCVAVASGVEALFDRLGYFTIPASQARMSVKISRQHTERLL